MLPVQQHSTFATSSSASGTTRWSFIHLRLSGCQRPFGSGADVHDVVGKCSQVDCEEGDHIDDDDDGCGGDDGTDDDDGGDGDDGDRSGDGGDDDGDCIVGRQWGWR